MCILFIYRNPHANAESYKLIVAANRDECLKRPALPAHYWKNYPGCLGGIDMEPGKEGGTWLALSVNGKAGVILNLSNEPGFDTPKKGRGSLITNFLTSDDSANTYLDKLHKENQNGYPYNPYNLILLEMENTKVHYLSSSIKSTGPYECDDSILGFGNSGAEVPYRKVVEGKKKFQDIVQNRESLKKNDLIEDLLRFLKSDEMYLPDPELQRRCPKSYKELSSIFVSVDEYGTRTHSLILVNNMNEVTFVEETLMPDHTWKRQIFNNKLGTESK